MGFRRMPKRRSQVTPTGLEPVGFFASPIAVRYIGGRTTDRHHDDSLAGRGTDTQGGTD